MVVEAIYSAEREALDIRIEGPPNAPLLDCIPIGHIKADCESAFGLCRTYGKGRILGHTRGKRNSKPNNSLVQIEGVSNKEEAQFYLGKVCKISI